jgi:hypothetical protein
MHGERRIKFSTRNLIMVGSRCISLRATGRLTVHQCGVFLSQKRSYRYWNCTKTTNDWLPFCRILSSATLALQKDWRSASVMKYLYTVDASMHGLEHKTTVYNTISYNGDRKGQRSCSRKMGQSRSDKTYQRTFQRHLLSLQATCRPTSKDSG